MTIDLCLDGPSRLWLYMALVMVSRVVADGGGCPERIAKHLSERVPTAGSIHVNTYTTTLVVDGTKTGYNTPTICVMIFGTTKTF